MANGKIVYYPDGVTGTTYTFEVNYQYGHGIGRLDLVSRKRALDGTAYSDKGPTKKTYSLQFIGAPATQKAAFEAAYDSGYPMDLYLDASAALTAEVEFDTPPDIISLDGFVDGAHTWEISVDLSET